MSGASLGGTLRWSLTRKKTHARTYPPGSIAVLQPRCSDKEVDEFLEQNKLESQADNIFIIRSTVPGQPLPTYLPHGATTLRTLLTHHLDLRSPPRKSLFEWLRRLTKDEREEERLDDFITDPDEIHDYATRPKRSILETLADFRETTLPMEYLLEILPPLRRRQFSIASNAEVGLPAEYSPRPTLARCSS